MFPETAGKNIWRCQTLIRHPAIKKRSTLAFAQVRLHSASCYHRGYLFLIDSTEHFLPHRWCRMQRSADEARRSERRCSGVGGDRGSGAGSRHLPAQRERGRHQCHPESLDPTQGGGGAPVPTPASVRYSLS